MDEGDLTWVLCPTDLRNKQWERIKPLIRSNRSHGRVQVTWGILAHHYLVDIKVTIGAPTESDVEKTSRQVRAKLQAQFGRLIFGTDSQTMEEVVGPSPMPPNSSSTVSPVSPIWEKARKSSSGTVL